METLQENMEKTEVTRELLLREIELEKSLQSILRQEEESWRLRSRVLWLKGGDQNTKLFQNKCRENQIRNTIRELKKDDGTNITGQATIKSEVRSFFESIYNNEEDVSQENMDEMIIDIPSMVSREDFQTL